MCASNTLPDLGSRVRRRCLALTERKTAKKGKRKAAKRKAAKRATGGGKGSKGFTAEERAAMKERARELKAEANREEGEKAVSAKIAEMKGSDRSMAKKFHAIVTESAPGLAPRTWYGMPAYADDDGKVVCYFQSAGKFKSRYATLGFNDAANLDKGAMWPTSFALKELTAAEERKIRALVKRAAS